MVAMLLAVSLQAQYSDLYYHRVGDTIMYDSPIYYHNWWGFEDAYQTQNRRHILDAYTSTAERKLLSYSFTAMPLEVIGLAVLQDNSHIYYHDYPIPQQEYYLIYEATPDSVYKVAEVPWSFDDTLSRCFFIRGNGDVHGWDIPDSDSLCCNNGMRWYKYFPVVEYYFDTPISVTDSFYVGYTYNSWQDYLEGGGFPFHYVGVLNGGGWVNCEGQSGIPSPYMNEECGLYWPSIVYGIPGTSTYVGHPDPWYANYWFIPMVFPIIRVDTTVPPPDYCPPVENLQVQAAGDSSVDVTWDAFINHQFGYEVQYGPRSMPMGNWQSEYPDLNFVHLSDLNPDLLYGIRVRPYCDADKREGKWCEPVYFFPTVGAATEPSALSEHTTVSPNPAKEKVTIGSDYVVIKVDLYDALGQHLWNFNVGSKQTTVDLDGLAAGRYHLLITTSRGVTAKTLIKM